MRLSKPQSRSGHCGVQKNLASVGNQTPAVQLVACRYNDCVNAAHFFVCQCMSVCVCVCVRVREKERVSSVI
jgi:hypothetical protein